jgi:predicted glycosyltransferase
MMPHFIAQFLKICKIFQYINNMYVEAAEIGIIQQALFNTYHSILPFQDNVLIVQQLLS